jgi:hypothetical protein
MDTGSHLDVRSEWDGGRDVKAGAGNKVDRIVASGGKAKKKG